MKVELPLGDIADRISILRIKSERISEASKVVNVTQELAALTAAWADTELPAVDTLDQFAELLAINGQLWDVEDALRSHEAAGIFDDQFVSLARSVYRLNDQRGALKREINIALGSTLFEEKSYPAYGVAHQRS